MVALHVGCAVQVCENEGSNLAQSKHLCQGLSKNIESGVIYFHVEGLAVCSHSGLPIELGNQIRVKLLLLCGDELHQLRLIDLPSQLFENNGVPLLFRVEGL